MKRKQKRRKEKCELIAKVECKPLIHGLISEYLGLKGKEEKRKD